MNRERGRTALLMMTGTAVVFFLFFFLISRYAPLAGDDWGYAAGGRYNSALMRAWQNYFSWSGRFLSELWGYSIAPHKKLWNILNAGIFTAVFVLLCRFAGQERRPLLLPVVCAAMMLSVPDELRMQTYTWIMGTTYIIPLMLFLVYIRILDRYVFGEGLNGGLYACGALFNLIIPLYMENAAAMIFGADCLVLIWLWVKDRRKAGRIVLYTLIALAGVLIIRLSPGALARSMRDHAAFNALPLTQKIAVNFPALINYTFLVYPWFYRILSVIVLFDVWGRKARYREIISVIAAAGIVCTFIELPAGLSAVFWLVYLAMLGVHAYGRESEEERWTGIFLLLCGCGANAVMLISPIFAIRSSVYTLYMFMLYGLYVLARTELSVRNRYILITAAAVGVLVCGIRYMTLYRMINRINLKRMSQIQYYADRPDSEDIWIMGYPENSVHSADVVEGDDFHEAVFKEYYFLNPDAQLHFYYLKEYDAGSILNG